MKKKNVLMTVVAIFGLATIAMAQTVPSYVPTNGLVGWWPFSGNANDESGVGNNGFTFGVNTPTLQSDRFGNSNSSYYFYGENGEIKIPTSNGDLLLDPMQDSYSVSFWLKSIDPTLTASTGLALHQWGGNTWTSYPFSFQISSATNNLSPKIYDGVSPNSAYVGNSVFDDQWHMITMVKDNFVDTLFSFADGVLIDAVEITLSGPLDPIYDTIRVGPRFLGQIDDLSIFNRPLTVCEIQDLYASQVNSTFVNAGADQTICNGDPVTLSAINSLNFSWDNGVADGVAFNPTSTQDYTVIADSAGCLSTDVVTVTVNENTSATQTQTALDSYTWTINSQTYTQSGTYTAVIPNAAGCDSTITLDLSLDFTGINEFSEDNLFTVFPNPAQSAINIKADNKLIGEIYTIYDNTGKVILTGKLNSQNTIIELGALSGGIYMFSVGENMKQTFKVIKE